ncbi:MAG: S1/P1 nuclease [Candidatus Marinimicrobia bacterium]|nr:S1/P1 nuclease [Candidatus Neomarinimicrobiota bacterium]MCF7851370.1 S1/P1 nuclease [Candidatus Neomarinimicrobiota bacterium]MCF7904204.1 S1/P1 nuclease [Candidatus Neomarinimicrobiota bacterium]
MRYLITLLISTSMLFAWGKTGHRIVGMIAEENLTPEAKEQIAGILGHTDLARISNWPDEIKSDPKWDHTHDWHYCTIFDGKEYEGPEAGGRAIQKVVEFSDLLPKGVLSDRDQKNILCFIVHIVGDLHQPLHVGNGTDRGGNAVDVTWFRDSTNLHSVWDSKMIDHMQYSYTEYAQQIQLALTDEEKAGLLNPDIMAYVSASRAAHGQVYDIGDGNLSWKYIYKNRELMEDRLLRGGFHLAAVLNNIFQ